MTEYTEVEPMLKQIKTTKELSELGFHCLSHFHDESDDEESIDEQFSHCWIWSNGFLRIIVKDRDDQSCEIVGEFTEETVQEIIRTQWKRADEKRLIDDGDFSELEEGEFMNVIVRFELGTKYSVETKVEVTHYDDKTTAIDLAKVMLSSELGLNVDFICESMNINSYDEQYVKVEREKEMSS
ncbi:hypothetical protein CR205_06745 [Alteribacter lacisalsi]|uniref:Uncharacterized protein n=1 Tax=Alteribacter lacisalsi TaxID=2045244 RepID=A0A2W0HE63_9BACI|nr:hypothetical protein [Alteribacter lacisalsi]PYZ98290.1 hypothetical protein CR205_06745 [Alteribacter lacisalsi]